MLFINKISILDIVEDTTVDGPGFRTSIYAAGCLHECPNCHNPESWDITNGHWKSIDEIMEIIKKNKFANVTFSGGDPLFQVDAFTELAKRIKVETSKSIWCYTGYRYEKLVNSKDLNKILPYIDVLVDGRFIEAKKDLSLRFRGSSNQRIIDVQSSIKDKKVILLDLL